MRRTVHLIQQTQASTFNHRIIVLLIFKIIILLVPKVTAVSISNLPAIILTFKVTTILLTFRVLPWLQA